MDTRFPDRAAAGEALAERLLQLRLGGPLLVLALPRGGVPVGAAVARALHAPLDLLLVRKIGAPWQSELAVAAVVEGDPPSIVVDEEVQRGVGVDAGYIRERAQREIQEIARRRHVYLNGRPRAELAGRTVILVDDGIATGTTVRAALRALQGRKAARIVLAVPVAAADTLASLRGEVDQTVCLSQPEPFHAVGLHYVDFTQVDDEQVLAILNSMAAEPVGATDRPAANGRESGDERQVARRRRSPE